MIYFFMLLMALLPSCKTRTIQSVSDKKEVSPIDKFLFTKVGENFSASFSRDGKKIIYCSKKRTTHSHSQVYEYDIEKNIERRITYSDGDSFNPRYISNDEIIYESTTDEIKEHDITSSLALESPPTEIYLSDLRGNDIQRLTRNAGFDGNAFFDATHGDIFYSSIRKGERKQINNKNESTFLKSKEADITYPAIINKGRNVCWIEEKASDHKMSIVCSARDKKNKKYLVEDIFYIHDLNVLDEATLLYSTKDMAQEKIKIKTLDINSGCASTLIEMENKDVYFPSVDIANKRIVVTGADTQGSVQVYLMPLPDVACDKKSTP